MTDTGAEVAVIGYGPVGATLANLLGQAGIRTSVYERSTDPYPLPRACHLDGEIMRIFQGVGLGDVINELVEPSRGMLFVDGEGQPLFDYEDFVRDPILGWGEDYVFIQPELDAALRAGAARFDCVHVRLGSEVTDWRELPARWVVACDGAASASRRMAGIEFVDLGYDQRWLVVDVMLSRPVALPDIIHQVCDPQRPATFVPSARNHRRWEFRIDEGESDEQASDPENVWRLLGPWLRPGDGELVRAAVYDFHATVAETWRRGRLLLAGDAAHQMPPFMGQGMCSGIRDAANLAWKLRAVLRDGTPEALLDSYEAERRPHVERCIELSIEAGRLLDEPVFPEPDSDDGERWSRLPPLTGLFQGAGGPVPFPVGHQARQPTVEVDGRRCLLDDVAGPGWYLVSDGPADGGGLARVLDATTLGDPDGWLARLLGGRAAVLIRPDRYVYGTAATAGDLADLLDDTRRRIGLPLG
ncbi:MAG: bifunctional 3-(3-hydroxy-phenyl)propionate/3-hydroxycinnamic acid hydroxylase [bacterium]|nr:bifunctional 3-(3-hydroxy-phenyl)propionate/3-hydroxycinnamic acid hydroxylase [bacterium]